MVAEQEPSSSQPAAIFQHEPSESITPVGDGMPSRNSSRQSVMHDQPELEDTSDFVGVMSLERKQRGSEFRSQDGFGSELASANLQPELPSPRARSRSPSVVPRPYLAQWTLWTAAAAAGPYSATTLSVRGASPNIRQADCSACRKRSPQAICRSGNAGA